MKKKPKGQYYNNDGKCVICSTVIPGMTTGGFARHVSKKHPAICSIGRKMYGSLPVYMWDFDPIFVEYDGQLDDIDKYSCPWCAKLFHKKGLPTHIKHCEPIVKRAELEIKAALADRPRDLYINPTDLVNHPSHYTSSPSGIECIDAIESALSPEEFRGFIKGNVIKYAWREKLKGGDEDLKKARWYLSRLVDGLDKKDNKKGDDK